VVTIVKIVIDHIGDMCVHCQGYVFGDGAIAEGGVVGFIKLRCFVYNL
jgi:hypothetical protein